MKRGSVRLPVNRGYLEAVVMVAVALLKPKISEHTAKSDGTPTTALHCSSVTVLCPLSVNRGDREGEKPHTPYTAIQKHSSTESC